MIQPPINGGKPCPDLHEYGLCNTHACPVDCIVEAWNAWTPCDKTCGGGTRSRTRSAVQPSAGGKPCPELIETEVCAAEPCPVDCAVSDWASWEPCSLECGSGEQTRHRAVLVVPRHGGLVCPPLVESRPCNTNPCPVVTCTVSAWSEWSDCTQACAGGTHFRTRRIIIPAPFGEACPALKEVRSCNEQPCRVDCVVGAWGAWDRCSRDCGGGTQQRSRYIEVQPQSGGTVCPTNLIETRMCNLQPCPQECVLAPWGEWSACSATCGGGIQTRSRAILVPSSGTASPCPPAEQLSETLHCNTHACPVDCIVGLWSDWSNCSRTCGSGERVRTRPVTTAPAFGGAACPQTVEYLACNDQPCPTDCVLETWGEWSACNSSCGNATRTRIRRIKVAAAGGQACTGAMEESEACILPPCPVDCQVGPWSSWTSCSAPCGSGSQIRSRTITSAAQHGGLPCPVLFEVQPCNTQPCTQTACLVSEWSSWGACNVSCNGGVQKRFRTVIKLAADCPVLEETRYCNVEPCPIDCVAGEWNPWATCSKVCGGGIQYRTREIVIQAAYGGTDCLSHERSQQRDCNQQACPVDCSVTAWGGWSPCSVPCGLGTQQRTRAVVQVPANGGSSCPSLLETRHCTSACAIDCVVEEWQPWSVCSQPCGKGSRSRIRYVSTAPTNGGAPCPALQESEDCNDFPCSIDCVVTSWSSWGPCSVSCGSGQQSRTRSVSTNAQYGGQACPPLIEVASCEAGPCPPTGCVVSAWSEWSNCSQACAGGTIQRIRTVISNPNTEQCPDLTETRVCNEQPCPVDCVLGAWTLWSACSVECGGGTRRRVRTFVNVAAHNGLPCDGPTEDTEPCNEQSCSIDCALSEWSDWSTCSAPCDAGTSFRRRTILQAPVGNGSACPAPLFESIVCNAEPCPCIVSAWSAWSPCTKTCDGGSRSRSRIVLRASSRGAACPQLEEYEECNTQTCTGNENDETGHYQPQPEEDPAGGNSGTDPTDVVVVIDGCRCGNPAAVNCLGACGSATCSGRGQCALSGLCACTNGFRGLTCGSCADGVENYPFCDRCAAGRYGFPLCNVHCMNITTCQGNGVCNNKGTCDCLPGYAGPRCDRCATGYFFSNGACRVCSAATTCSGNGRCLSDGSCQCVPGFGGNNCNTCEAGSADVYPACKPFGSQRASDVSGKGAAADCPTYGGTVALAVILSILGTALLAAAFIAAFLFMKRKQQKSKPMAYDDMDSTLLNEYQAMSSTRSTAAIDDDKL